MNCVESPVIVTARLLREVGEMEVVSSDLTTVPCQLFVPSSSRKTGLGPRRRSRLYITEKRLFLVFFWSLLFLLAGIRWVRCPPEVRGGQNLSAQTSTPILLGDGPCRTASPSLRCRNRPGVSGKSWQDGRKDNAPPETFASC